MNNFTRRLITLICLLTISTFVHGEDYYLVDGDKIPLAVSELSKALRLAPTQGDEFRRFVSGIDDVELVEFNGLANKGYRIVLIRPSEGIIDPAFARIFRPIAGHPAVEREVPVFQTGGIELLWINRFTVQFADSFDTDNAGKLLKDAFQHPDVSDTIPVKDAPIASDGYTVVLPETLPASSALETINGLKDRSEVIYAYPEFIRVYPPRGLGTDRPAPRASGGTTPSSPGCDSPSQELIATPSTNPNDEYFRNQWSLENRGDNPFTGDPKFTGKPGADIKILKAWNSYTRGSEDVTIAVIDNGVQMNHPDLDPKIKAGFDATGNNNPNPSSAADFHGTAVAGLAAATTDNNTTGIAGVDWHAELYPVKFAYGSSSGASATLPSDEAMAIDAAVLYDADVLVNAWNANGTAEDQSLNRAIERAIFKGHVVVFSAGNHELGQLNCLWDTATNTYDCPRAVRYPATLVTTSKIEEVQTGLIVVGATNFRDQVKTTSVHNTTALLPSYPGVVVSQDNEDLWGSNIGPEITVSAPGIHLYTTNIRGGYRCFNGTSGAAPLVAGAAALLLSLHPNATPAEIKNWLQKGADPGAGQASQPDIFYGHGRLNVTRSLDAARVDMSLQVQRPLFSFFWNRPIGPNESRWVRATVSRNGQLLRNVTVEFSSDDPVLLTVDSPATVVTDEFGVAEGHITGQSSGPATTTSIEAFAEGTKVSANVRVPSLPVWIIGSLALIGVLWSLIRDQQRISNAIPVSSVAFLAIADVSGFLPLQSALQPLAELIAFLVVQALKWCQFAVVRSGPFVYVPGGFGYEINHLCTAFWPAAFLGTVILSDAAVTVGRLRALTLSLLVLLSLNILRLISLFSIGVLVPAQFALMHDVIWPGIMVLTMFALWLRVRKCSATALDVLRTIKSWAQPRFLAPSKIKGPQSATIGARLGARLN